MKAKYLIGTVWETNNFGKIEIIKKLENRRALIKFLNDGTIVEVGDRAISSGEIKNPNAKVFLGIGYKGIGPHLMTNGFNVKTKEYNLWSSMLRRCYGDKRVRIKSTVCERWHNFQNFCEDLPKLENYHKWIEFGPSKFHLDKDVKGDNFRIYSLETCMFLESYLNEAQGSRCSERQVKKPIYEVYLNNEKKFVGNAIQVSNFLKMNRQSVIRRVKLKIFKNGLKIINTGYKEV